MGNLFNPWLKR